MRLRDLENYDRVTIQCHDNPDADAIGAGYGLYCYFQSKGKKVRLIYSGINQISKSNLKLLLEELKLPLEYIPPRKAQTEKLEGLLITVDCQYGAGNVTKFQADQVAVIDHHQIERSDIALSRIQPNLGSCSTLVWRMLQEEQFSVSDDNWLGTALYYGLYTDTNQFSELSNPLDMDMRESVPYEKSMITLFRNSNLSLQELETAGVALLRHSYNDDYHFSVIKAGLCDPNILGIISDFLLQVDLIKTCVVFNEADDGFKFSVRSCIKEVNASEMAVYLAGEIGSGGGHQEKAGGFISKTLYEKKYPTLHSEGYFNNRMVEYFDSYRVVQAGEYVLDRTGMELYEKKPIPLGYVKADNVLPVGTPITIRSQAGDIELAVGDDLYLVITHHGEVIPMRQGEFAMKYQIVNEKYCIDDCDVRTEYIPSIKNRNNGQSLVLSDYAWKCLPVGKQRFWAKKLEGGLKLFTLWDKTKYQLGNPGDYILAKETEERDLSIVEKKVFERTYQIVERIEKHE